MREALFLYRVPGEDRGFLYVEVIVWQAEVALGAGGALTRCKRQ